MPRMRADAHCPCHDRHAQDSDWPSRGRSFSDCNGIVRRLSKDRSVIWCAGLGQMLLWSPTFRRKQCRLLPSINVVHVRLQFAPRRCVASDSTKTRCTWMLHKLRTECAIFSNSPGSPVTATAAAVTIFENICTERAALQSSLSVNARDASYILKDCSFAPKAI